MKRALMILTILLSCVLAGAQEIRRFPPDDSLSCVLWDICLPPERVIPIKQPPYAQIKRSVGVCLQVIDKSIGPIRWWHVLAPLGEPNWVHVASVRDRYDLTSVSMLMQAHPTINYDENIRKLFRLDGIDTIVFRPEHWGVVDERCDGSQGVLWTQYPAEVGGWEQN